MQHACMMHEGRISLSWFKRIAVGSVMCVVVKECTGIAVVPGQATATRSVVQLLLRPLGLLVSTRGTRSLGIYASTPILPDKDEHRNE